MRYLIPSIVILAAGVLLVQVGTGGAAQTPTATDVHSGWGIEQRCADFTGAVVELHRQASDQLAAAMEDGDRQSEDVLKKHAADLAKGLAWIRAGCDPSEDGGETVPALFKQIADGSNDWIAYPK